MSIRWPHGGKTAYICGAFTQWQKMPMQWRQTNTGGEWSKVIKLTPGSYQYKFIVDGQWRHDHTAPTILDQLGNVNNCISVHPQDRAAGQDAASSGDDGARASLTSMQGDEAASPDSMRDATTTEERAARTLNASTSDPYHIGGAKSRGGSDSYGQVIPPREELLLHHSASLLLPQQLRLLLPQLRGDAATSPLPCQMQHVFCSQRPDILVFSIAHRYKDRSVTQLLYKPVLRKPDAGGGEAGGGDMMATEDRARRPSEVRNRLHGVMVRSVRIPATQRQREEGGGEVTYYLVESALSVHGTQTTLRSARRYKHFDLLDTMLHKEFGALVPQAMPAKRVFGHMQPGFVEERRAALERYLQLCIGVPEIANSSTFCMFVEADGGKEFTGPQRDFGHQTQGSAKLIEQVGYRQGYLYKLGRRVSSWKRRYFCLCDGDLFYYYSLEMSNPFKPLGVVPLHEARARGGSTAEASLQASLEGNDAACDSSGGGAHTSFVSSCVIAPLPE